MLKETVINGRNLYPSKKYKRFKHLSGNLYADGAGWYSFALFNQLPGMMGDGLVCPGFSGHYTVSFNPDTGEIKYKKFGDYGGLTYFIEVDEAWVTPESPALCTYLRKLCRDAWEGAHLSKITEIELDETGNPKYWKRAPVNIHTGEQYENCYYLLIQTK